MQVEQAVSQQAVGQLYIVKQVLEGEVQRLYKQREEAGRFLKIDEELAELTRLTALKTEVLAQTAEEASETREAARRDADSLMASARLQVQALVIEAVQQGKRDADDLIREAQQAGNALRESAETVYRQARQKTANVDEDLAGRLEVCAKRELKFDTLETVLKDRVAALGRAESLVDGKRSMLRAGIEALRRVLDEVQA